MIISDAFMTKLLNRCKKNQITNDERWELIIKFQSNHDDLKTRDRILESLYLYVWKKVKAKRITDPESEIELFNESVMCIATNTLKWIKHKEAIYTVVSMVVNSAFLSLVRTTSDEVEKQRSSKKSYTSLTTNVSSNIDPEFTLEDLVTDNHQDMSLIKDEIYDELMNYFDGKCFIVERKNKLTKKYYYQDVLECVRKGGSLQQIKEKLRTSYSMVSKVLIAMNEELNHAYNYEELKNEFLLMFDIVTDSTFPTYRF